MKTVKTTLKLKWTNLGNNSYSTVFGGLLATVHGKKYFIDNLRDPTADLDCPLFAAKSRSVEDSLKRATNKLAKLASV